MTVIKGVYDFLNVAGNYSRCARVFELLVYLSARARAAVLFRALRARNLLLSRVPSCLIAAAVYRVSVESLSKLSRNFKGG